MTAPLVLVVDDDAAIRLLLRRLIERHGLRVVEAGDARAARAGLDIDHPDAVILDLVLPDRDGLELVPELAQQAAVIVVSARADSDEKVAALDLGAEDYVTKPFDGEELMARLRGALRRRVRAATGETTIAFDDVAIDLENPRVTRGGEEVHFSLAVNGHSENDLVGASVERRLRPRLGRSAPLRLSRQLTGAFRATRRPAPRWLKRASRWSSPIFFLIPVTRTACWHAMERAFTPVPHLSPARAMAWDRCASSAPSHARRQRPS